MNKAEAIDEAWPILSKILPPNCITQLDSGEWFVSVQVAPYTLRSARSFSLGQAVLEVLEMKP